MVPTDSFVSILTEHKFGERERGVSESTRRQVPASLQVVVEHNFGGQRTSEAAGANSGLDKESIEAVFASQSQLDKELADE